MRKSPVRVGAGQTYGRLTVLERLPRGPKDNTRVRVRCECGKEKVIFANGLPSGKVISCGCYSAEKSRTHGLSYHPLYGVWQNMHNRCYRPEAESYKYYGARGIGVDPRWHGDDGLRRFMVDMGPKPSPKHSIERDDVNADYSPGNCRWATDKEQHRNKRRNHWLTINGETKIISDWARLNGIKVSRILSRLKSGWPVEAAVGPVKPLGERGRP